MDHNSLSVAEFADLLSSKLKSYRPTPGKLSSYLFHFDGQDPLGFAEPSSAIAALHRSLVPKAQDRLEVALLDVMGSRGDVLPDEALKQLALAVGNLRRRALLVPLVNRICARARFQGTPRMLFVMAIMVLKGFGAQSTVFEATRTLAQDAAFPPDLLIDAFEILLDDEASSWAETFRLVREAIEVDYADDPERLNERLVHTATMLMQISPTAAAGCLSDLIAHDARSLYGRTLYQRHDVTASLARALIAAGAPEPACEPAEEPPGCLSFLEPA